MSQETAKFFSSSSVTGKAEVTKEFWEVETGEVWTGVSCLLVG